MSTSTERVRLHRQRKREFLYRQRDARINYRASGIGTAINKHYITKPYKAPVKRRKRKSRFNAIFILHYVSCISVIMAIAHARAHARNERADGISHT